MENQYGSNNMVPDKREVMWEFKDITIEYIMRINRWINATSPKYIVM